MIPIKYKKLFSYILLVGIFITPNLSLANGVSGQCSANGYTITTINGIFTDDDGAKQNMRALEYKVGKIYQSQIIDYQYLFNPSHVGGIGDVLKSIYQGVFDQETVEDYDLVEMLRSASEKVQTQKLLLVAHSQGNFYANSFYDVATKQAGGIPKESVGVYSVATPASRVVGGGKWLTSDTDIIIAKVVGRVPFKKIMPPNTHIDLRAGDDANGHDFKDIYLKYRAQQIVSDIQSSLDKLSTNSIQNEQSPCLVPPDLTFAHKIEGQVFAIVDPAASVSISAIAATAKMTYQASSMIADAVINTAAALGSVVNSIIKLPVGVSNSLTASNLAGPATLMPEQNNSAANPQSAILPPVVQKSSSVGIDTDAGFASPPQTASSVTVPEHNNTFSVTAVFATPQAQNKPDSYHDYGGGRTNLEVKPPNDATSSVLITSIPNLEVGLPSDATPPAPPVIVSPADFTETFTTSTITFQGTAEASSTISTDFDSSTATANAAGDWQMALNFPQGASMISFFAKDEAGNKSNPTEISLFVDSVAPRAPELSIAECAASLSSEGCLVATTTLTLNWSVGEDDLDYYELSYGDIVSTTTAISQILHLSDNASYDFTFRARDRAGNWSETATASAVVNIMPVVINEVAWAGTVASANDEWIELYNRTPLAIVLDKWTLRADDGVPYIKLSGSIAPKNYYLIERSNDNTISDIADDLTMPFSGLGGGSGLGNNGETLLLSYHLDGAATTTVDQTAVHAWAWLGGNDYYKSTMERYDFDMPGALSSNWGTNNRLIKNGKDANGSPLSGTPKARNSINYLIANGNPYINGNVILTKSHSPYLVNNTLQVFQTGSTLMIEPGVVIKFNNDAGLQINGSIDVRGTADNPIVFTSFNDDTYGGDLNGDATSTSPSSGSWYGVRVNSGSNSAVFDYAIFRYGGKYYSGTGAPMANFYVKDATAMVSHSISEYSKVYGLQSVNADIQMRDNTFRFNNKDIDPAGVNAGVYVSGGAPQIVSNTFFQNKRGLYLSSSPGIVSDNIFSSNASEAVYSAGLLSSFSNNQGSNNAINGLIIAGAITPANSFSTTTLIANSLPYVVPISTYDYPKVSASSTLVIEKGAVIKSRGQILVEGKLAMDGENPEDIVFTSFYDDSVGGDTANDATSTLPAPGQWPGIYVYPGGSVNARGFTLRYAGSEAYGGNNSAGIVLNGAMANISNALFDSNYPSGIYAASGSLVNIENASFENHNKLGAWGRKAAFAFVNSGVSLNSVVFTNNFLGIMGDLLSSVVASGVEFINNTATTSPANLF